MYVMYASKGHVCHVCKKRACMSCMQAKDMYVMYISKGHVCHVYK